MIKTPDIDPSNTNKKINDENYYLYQYNGLIFLDVILKYSKDYLDDDFDEWIKKKNFHGSKSDYWYILNIHTYVCIYV